MAFSKRGMFSKLETINESSPLVCAENNNNSSVHCELGNNCNSSYPTKKIFDRTFSYTMCLGAITVIVMLGLVLLAESFGGHGHGRRFPIIPFSPDAEVQNGSLVNDNTTQTININTVPI